MTAYNLRLRDKAKGLIENKSKGFLFGDIRRGLLGVIISDGNYRN